MVSIIEADTKVFSSLSLFITYINNQILLEGPFGITADWRKEEGVKEKRRKSLRIITG